MAERIKILIASDVDYGKLIAEMYVDEKFIGLISQEKGVENLLVEFPVANQNEGAISRQIEYEVLLAALLKAKTELLNLKQGT
jgi:hypothetical protein